MKKTLHSGTSRLLTLISAFVLSGILPACTDDAERELPDKEKGETATLELSLSVPPIVETKAVICESDSGSEARKAGFYHEMQVLTTDTAKTAATKATSSLKNIYAFLFKSDGTFNGRASLATASTSSGVTLVFTNIGDAINVMLASAAYNFKRAMKVLLDLIQRWKIYLEISKIRLENNMFPIGFLE